MEHQKQTQEVKQSYEAEHRKQSEYIDKILRYFPYVEKLMPMIKYLSEKMGFNDNLIKALCTFKEIPIKGKIYSTMFNQSFSADGAVCSLKEDREDDLTLESMVFRITLGSDARKMSLWKHWDDQQAEDKIEG
ncbi:MAG: hypothetical protein IJN24_00735 [Bacteroidaceae bacterium]|nr:hypothetical protein [Bacteroidaceae bacterium]